MSGRRATGVKQGWEVSPGGGSSGRGGRDRELPDAATVEHQAGFCQNLESIFLIMNSILIRFLIFKLIIHFV